MLLVEAGVLKEFSQLAFDDAREDGLRLARRLRLGAQDFLFPLEDVRRNVVFANKAGAGGADLHGQVVDQLPKLLAPGHEVRFAIHFDHDANLAAGVDVRPDEALGGQAVRFFCGRRLPTFAKNGKSLIQVPARLIQGSLALHHRSAAHLAQFLDELRRSAHSSVQPHYTKKVGELLSRLP